MAIPWKADMVGAGMPELVAKEVAALYPFARVCGVDQGPS